MKLFDMFYIQFIRKNRGKRILLPDFWNSDADIMLSAVPDNRKLEMCGVPKSGGGYHQRLEGCPPPHSGYECDRPEEKEWRVGGGGFLQATPDRRTWSIKPTWRVKKGGKQNV